MKGTFKIVNCDTDSISICKKTEKKITEEERLMICDKINSLFEEHIKFEDDGYFKRFLVIKAKNYVMVDDKGNKVYKGSSIKDAKKEPILKQLMYDVIDNLIDNRKDLIYDTYHKYVYKAGNIEDITPWCSKKTITKAVLEAKDTTQKRIKAALDDKVLQEGRKVYMFNVDKDTMCLRENFDGTYCRTKMYRRVYDTMKIFKDVIDVDLLPNFSLRRNSDRI